MRKMTGEEILQGIDEMIEEAPGVGLCTIGFKILRDSVADLIAERDALAERIAAMEKGGTPSCENRSD